MATIVGLLGAGGLLVAVVALWAPYRMGFSVRPTETYRELWAQRTSKRLTMLLALALASLIAETCGLGLAAALAS
jgi:hypothetical protein